MLPLVYNLFPRLAGRMPEWMAHAERARRMGFEYLYINPVSYPGFSGSLYSVKDYYRVCPDFLPAGAKGDGQEKLARTLAQVRDLGLAPVMDLVINHTGIDNELVREHPDWYVRDKRGKVVSPHAVDPGDANKVTVWGDLAEIDNADCPDLEHLWGYWRELVRNSLKLGWRGFRCDAAYKVPAALWRMLIEEAKSIDPKVVFLAETLGCRLEEVRATKTAGFDYLFNSIKYWQFDAPWALQQHNEFAAFSRSIGFAESHDTKRLFAETHGNLAVQRQRYLLAALFSAGVLLPLGFEFGFTKRVNVVRSTPADWEQTGIDLTDFIRNVHALKASHAVLRDEGLWAARSPYNQPTLVLEKTSGPEGIIMLVNKDWSDEQRVDLPVGKLRPGTKLLRIESDGRTHQEALTPSVALAGAEIALVV